MRQTTTSPSQAWLLLRGSKNVRVSSHPSPGPKAFSLRPATPAAMTSGQTRNRSQTWGAAGSSLDSGVCELVCMKV